MAVFNIDGSFFQCVPVPFSEVRAGEPYLRVSFERGLTEFAYGVALEMESDEYFSSGKHWWGSLITMVDLMPEKSFVVNVGKKYGKQIFLRPNTFRKLIYKVVAVNGVRM